MHDTLDLDELLEGIRRWIAIESPTDDAEGMARMAAQVQADYEAFGARVERIPGRDGFGDHVLAVDDRHCPPEAAAGPGIPCSGIAQPMASPALARPAAVAVWQCWTGADLRCGYTLRLR